MYSVIVNIMTFKCNLTIYCENVNLIWKSSSDKYLVMDLRKYKFSLE